MKPTLTIAVPTMGRPILRHTLDSIARQDLTPDDQVLVVFDSFQGSGDLEATRELVESYGYTFVLFNGGHSFYGNPQLNHAISLARGDYFCALGDDDIYVDGAIARLRAAIKPGRAVLFQFYAPPFLAINNPRRFLLWQTKQLRVANISGCCVAAPRAALVPVSAERRIEVDFEWIVDIVAKTGQKPIWLRDCLIIARPDLRDGEPVHQGVGTCRGCGWEGFLEDMDADLLCHACEGTVLRSLLEARA